jgi:hypothetical protein
VGTLGNAPESSQGKPIYRLELSAAAERLGHLCEALLAYWRWMAEGQQPSGSQDVSGQSFHLKCGCGHGLRSHTLQPLGAAMPGEGVCAECECKKYRNAGQHYYDGDHSHVEYRELSVSLHDAAQA